MLVESIHQHGTMCIIYSHTFFLFWLSILLNRISCLVLLFEPLVFLSKGLRPSGHVAMYRNQLHNTTFLDFKMSEKIL